MTRHKMFFLSRVILTALIVATVSCLINKKPLAAGFIAVLPFISVLSLVFAYEESHDMQKMNQFAVSALCAIPLSMSFFIPFAANRWLRLSFSRSLLIGFLFLAGAYSLAYGVMKK